MNCPKCGKPMNQFEAAFLSRQEREYTVWLGACGCVECNIYIINRGPTVPGEREPESFMEGLRIGANHYRREKVG